MTGDLDAVNRGTWGRDDVVEAFVERSGPIDAGEAVLLERLAPEFGGRPVLDLGYGGGRTVPLLRAVSEDYVGVDYVPELVAAAQRRFPGVRLEGGDARDLSRFPDASFALVFFSFNGIDGIAHADRPLVLREVRRVLEPGGVFAYSTHNLDHSSAGNGFVGAAGRELMRRPWAAVRHVRRIPGAIRSYGMLRRHSEAGEGWAILPDPSYGFSVVLHHVTLRAALDEAHAAGFEQLEVIASDGTAVPEAASDTSTPWFHLLARAPQ